MQFMVNALQHVGYHYTSRRKLSSILEHGLIPRKTLMIVDYTGDNLSKLIDYSESIFKNSPTRKPHLACLSAKTGPIPRFVVPIF